jgi:hypothetical protein
MLSAAKMAHDYEEIRRLKRMKDKALGISIEKIIERKRKLQDDAKSTIPLLPALVTGKNSPKDIISRNNTTTHKGLS